MNATLYVVRHAVELCGLLAAIYSAGWLFEGALAPSRLPRGDHLTRFVLGLLAWIAFVFAIAALGWLVPAAVWTAIGALVLALSFQLWRSAWRPAWPRRPASGRTQLACALPLIVALACALVAVGLAAMSTAVAWDASAYHLTIPRLYIEHHGFRAIPFNVYSNWPLGIELLFAMAMLLHDYVLATLLHCGFAVLLLVAIVAFCRRWAPAWIGLLAATLLIANDVVRAEAHAAYIDLAVAFLFFAAFVYVVRALDAPEQRRTFLVLSGVCCGLMAGAKLNGVFGLLAVGAVYVLDGARAVPRLRRAAEAALYLGIPTLLLLAPWVAKSVWYTGNPVYPFLYEVFGGPDWSAELTARFATWQRGIGMGRSLADYALLPFRVILQGGEGYGRFHGSISAAWLVLVPLALVVAPRQRTVARCLVGAAAYFALWAASTQQMRLLIPVLPLVAVASALAIHHLLDRARRPAVRTALGTIVAGAAAVLCLRALAGDLALVPRLLAAYGRPRSELRTLWIHPVWGVVDERVPASARILFLNTNRGFFCGREYIADSFFEASQLSELFAREPTVDALAARLRGMGLTHILVGPELWIPYPDTIGRLVADPLHAESLYVSPDGQYALFALR